MTVLFINSKRDIQSLLLINGRTALQWAVLCCLFTALINNGIQASDPLVWSSYCDDGGTKPASFSDPKRASDHHGGEQCGLHL